MVLLFSAVEGTPPLSGGAAACASEHPLGFRRDRRPRLSTRTETLTQNTVTADPSLV